MRKLLYALLLLVAFPCEAQRISSLPAATTPVGGGELTAIVQGGVTSRLAINNLLASSSFDNLLCSTQGSIAYRNATVWVCLTPGTSGQFLKTLGSGANPLWATPAGAGNVTAAGTLTNNLPVIGQGGTAVAVGTVSGNTTEFGTVTGTLTSGNCIKSDASGNLIDAGAACGGATGELIGIQRITATGSYTYTPTTGTNSVIVELQGGGGGGGAVAQAAANQVNVGAGGAGGCWLRVRLTANFSGATGSVGAKGTGGAAGNNAGNPGSNTTFITTGGSPVTYTAAGGSAGTNTGSVPPPTIAASVGGGACTNGDDLMQGGPSIMGLGASVTSVHGGAGGASRYSRGAGAPFVFSAGGAVGNNCPTGDKGGGGSGAISDNNAGGTKAGGDGCDGEVIIWEYK